MYQDKLKIYRFSILHKEELLDTKNFWIYLVFHWHASIVLVVMKVGNEERIHVYYAHGEDNTTFVRRCYWLLDKYVTIEHHWSLDIFFDV